MKLKKDNTLRSLFTSVMCGLALLFVMSSCDDDDDEAVEPVDVAYVSLYNASPNSPDLDIIVDNRQINVYPFDYADYTGYLRFYTGDRTLKFGPYGASNVVEDTTVNFENSKAYSVFLVDEYPNLDALILQDNAEAPSDGNAMIRFVHLSPDAPAVDLAVEGESDVLYDDQSFEEPSDFMEISADEYDFEVRANDNDDVVLSIPDVDIQAGWFYTIIVRGYANPDNSEQNVLSADIVVN